MAKIVMADMYTVCDANGAPLGHGVKVGNEYYRCLSGDFEVEQYVNADVVPCLENKNAKALPIQLRADSGKFKRIYCTFKNLWYIYKKHPGDVIWAYVPDIYAFLFECLFPKGRRRLANIVFDAYSGSKAKQMILGFLCRKSDIIIVTNEHLKKVIPGALCVPDYAYGKEYERFRSRPKKEMVVCLGTMHIKKNIKEAVEVFTQIGYPLTVVGQFASRELYEQAIKNKGNNVVVENRYLSEEEYYTLLGASKFCLIPYDPDFYKDRTSGVLQECMFLDTVPITHRSILEFSAIPGIGYTSLSDLKQALFFKQDWEGCYKKYREFREGIYDRAAVKKCMVEEFRKVSQQITNHKGKQE